ncbi:hypothetical protein PR048_033096 [Dryococelus australis]|uniref:Uncharacterized protein n=1 Tax=Dryococelus australis TaxID=614101 RepID=A0ABQ9G3H8_9NEOP|nr:hypothetical protein PR048_033096 [Dryococelus australis]
MDPSAPAGSALFAHWPQRFPPAGLLVCQLPVGWCAEHHSFSRSVRNMIGSSCGRPANSGIWGSPVVHSVLVWGGGMSWIWWALLGGMPTYLTPVDHASSGYPLVGQTDAAVVVGIRTHDTAYHVGPIPLARYPATIDGLPSTTYFTILKSIGVTPHVGHQRAPLYLIHDGLWQMASQGAKVFCWALVLTHQGEEAPYSSPEMGVRLDYGYGPLSNWVSAHRGGEPVSQGSGRHSPEERGLCPRDLLLPPAHRGQVEEGLVLVVGSAWAICTGIRDESRRIAEIKDHLVGFASDDAAVTRGMHSGVQITESLRNRLGDNVLSSLMRIQMKSPSVCDYDPDDAIQLSLHSSQRKCCPFQAPYAKREMGVGPSESDKDRRVKTEITVCSSNFAGMLTRRRSEERMYSIIRSPSHTLSSEMGEQRGLVMSRVGKKLPATSSNTIQHKSPKKRKMNSPTSEIQFDLNNTSSEPEGVYIHPTQVQILKNTLPRALKTLAGLRLTRLPDDFKLSSHWLPLPWQPSRSPYHYCARALCHNQILY